MPYRLHLHFFYIFLSLAFVLNTTKGVAQENNFQNCVVVEKINPDAKRNNTVYIQNNSDTVIKCIFEFSSNGFFDESSLQKIVLTGLDSLNSKARNQLIILDNIAKIIKSPSHRNFHLLFTASSSFIDQKKFSPLAMISSFYDKQCSDYQRLAAQIAILTPYFSKNDFKSYYINQHNVIDIKIGTEWVFHDFDPGQPGFRFYKDSEQNTFASFYDLLNNPLLIKKEQFYTYNALSLCPWITDTYYRSLFCKLNGESTYTEIDKVFGFIPRWTIPPHTEIIITFPDTSIAGKFGTEVMLNGHDILIKKVFKAYTKYKKKPKSKHLHNINKYISQYLKKKFNFNFDFNLLYLIDSGLVYKGDSTIIKTKAYNDYISITVNTGLDTILFPVDYHIPLPLHKVKVFKGSVTIIESELTNNRWEDLKYNITDSLLIKLYNDAPPVATSGDERKAKKLDGSSLIFGPSNGYIAPHSTVTFQYYYNPFYYAFHDLVFKIHYVDGCKDKLNVGLK